MADYWKSQPRKFCDFCKCWLTDNKPSVEFHERGKRHQENVKRKITEITRKGHKALVQKSKMEREFQKMEQAALKAYEKDRELNPDLPEAPAPTAKAPELDFASCSRVKFTANKKGVKSQKDSQSPTEEIVEGPEPAPIVSTRLVKDWLECLTSGGQTYYWNAVTNASRRDVPSEGYLSINDQKRSILQGPTSSDERRDPYGSWTPAETSFQSMDLQLPPKPVKLEPVFTVAEPEPEEFKIKEKTVSSLQGDRPSDDAPASFKKRKLNWGSRKNIRIKTEDE